MSNNLLRRKPKISFVITGRNDDYGRNFLNRIRTTVRTLIYLTNKHQSNFELILVDYNPPHDKKPLIKELHIKNNKFLPIKSIKVPADFHIQIAKNSKNPFLEYVAKNIGIRRANGEYILTTNPDIIFSEQLVAFLTHQSLEKNSFYRINRHDLSLRMFDDNMSPDEILALCPKVATRVWTKYGLFYVSYSRWLKRFLNKPKPKNLLLFPLLNPLFKFIRSRKKNILHVAAAGDFLLTHKKNWEKIRGYDQAPFNSFIDGYNLHTFYCFNINQQVILYPIFHINHDSFPEKRPMIDLKTYKKNTTRMIQTKVPHKINDETWGFPNVRFEEQIIK